MSDTEEIDTNELMSKACEQSIVIQDLIESRSPEAVDEFMKFYDLAIRALDCQLDKVSHLEMEDSNHIDVVSQKTNELKKVRDNLLLVNKELDTIQKENDQLTPIVAAAQHELDILSEEEDTTEYKSQIEEAKRQIEELQAQISESENKIQEYIAIRTEKEEAMKGVEALNPDEQAGIEGRIRKNKRRIKDLQAHIKRTKSASVSHMNMTDDSSAPEEDVSANAPSMIVHHTADTVQDRIRDLKTGLEEALKKNGAVKTELNSLRHDADAMRMENDALKEIMRSIQQG